jgi:hypothetical protein
MRGMNQRAEASREWSPVWRRRRLEVRDALCKVLLGWILMKSKIVELIRIVICTARYHRKI